MKTTALGMILALGMLLCLGTSSFAVYFVDGGSGDDANNGAGWGTAWKTVTNALAQAVAPSEIWVKAGTYYPTTDTNRFRSITMKAGVDLYGGFAGTEASRGERDWSNNVTIFSGDIGTSGDPTDNSYHVVTGATARIDGFVIQDGRADSADPVYYRGGGMYTAGAYPITANCIFLNNQAGSGDYSGGGGVYWEQGTYTPCTVGWYNCTFDANVANGPAASAYGGGMNLHFWTNTVGAISNCVFKNNVSTGGSSSISALYLLDAYQTIWPTGAAFEVADCLFSNNTAYQNGGAGAIQVEGFVAPVVFRDCQFIANSNTAGVGGAMFISVNAQGQGVQMTGCVFDGNYCGYVNQGGGAIYFSAPGGGTNSFWHNCIFRNNAARTWGGGAIYGLIDGTFDTCDFVSNSAPGGVGGAIEAYGGYGCVTNDVFTNCTFTANTSGGGAGAVYFEYPLTFKNCAFTGNTMGPNSVGGAIQGFPPVGTTSVISQCTFTSNGTFTGNNYVHGGGAIQQGGEGNLIIAGSVFTQNKAHSFGGALWVVSPATVTASNCLFISNAVAHDAGGAWCSRSPAGLGTQKSTVMRSVFVGNTAFTQGGGIYFENGSQTEMVANCVFRDNRTTSGGGAIANYSTYVIISNVTVYTNTSADPFTAGALWTAGPNVASIIVNSIFWDNAPFEITPTTGVTANYSCIRGGFAGTGNISVDPLFADLTYLHEQSKYGYYDGGYFTGGTWLTSANNSPTIDAGDPTSDFSLEPVSGGRINMGAYGDTEVASKSKLINAGLILQIQ